jgi:hypothetical protein
MQLRRMLAVNTAIGSLFFVANGAAALAMMNGHGNWSTAQVVEAWAFALVGLNILIAGVSMLMGAVSMEVAVRWQSLALSLLLVALLLWGMALAAQGPGEQSRVAWMAGVLSALALYTRHSLIHTLEPGRIRRIRPALAAACAIAVAVDLGVVVRLGLL